MTDGDFLTLPKSGFLVSSDGTRIKCTLCFDARSRWPSVNWPARSPPEWIGVEARSRHRKSAFHTKALEVLESQHPEVQAETEQVESRNLDETLAVQALFDDLDDGLDDDLEMENQDFGASSVGYETDRLGQSQMSMDGSDSDMPSDSESRSSNSDEEGYSDELKNLTSEERQQKSQAHWKARKMDLERGDYYPYDGIVTFLLDVVDNFARQKLSDAQLKGILMVLDAAGVEGVPSLSRFRDIQQSLAKSHGVRQHKIANPGPPTLRVPVDDEPEVTGAKKERKTKDPLYVNDPRDLVALHWANPHVRPHIQKYPTYLGGEGLSKPLKEIWDGGKFDDLPLSSLPPMWEHPINKKHFYVGELATERGGSRAWIPLRWMRNATTGAILTEAIPVKFEIANVRD